MKAFVTGIAGASVAMMVAAHVADDGTVTPIANAGTIGDTLCGITDGALIGKVPPYPDDSWQAGGF